MLHKYEIEVNNSNNLKDNDMLNCSMELSLLNNLYVAKTKIGLNLFPPDIKLYSIDLFKT